MDLFDRSTKVIENLDPMYYARALTDDVQKARELVQLIKLVAEMGLTYTIQYDDEREFYSANSNLTK